MLLITCTLIQLHNCVTASVEECRSPNENPLKGAIKEAQARSLKDLISKVHLKAREKSKKTKVVNKEIVRYRKEFIDYIRSRKGKHLKNFDNDHMHSFIQTTDSQNDLASNFFGNQNFKINIYDLPLSGRAKTCWSGSYFPMANGLIAVRYCQNSKDTIGAWSSQSQSYSYYYTYSQGKAKYSQPSEYNSGPYPGDELSRYVSKYYSAAEKYDLLCGDTSFYMTQWMFWKSDQYAVNGKIPSWYGICHGWSPASYYYDSPTKGVTLLAADGVTYVHFYPDDVKALASQFWAQADYTTRFSGNRCPYENSNSIKSDYSTGLYTDPLCSSINAGDFVKIIANQIGLMKKNFSIDPSPDGEIWNHPVNGYELIWYNLNTNIYSTSDISKNFININDLSGSSDPFLNFVYRKSPSNTAFVVGVYIKVEYALETDLNPSDISFANLTQTDEWLGAIRLDSRFNIINGEWSSNDHPNFAWTPDESSDPSGLYDGSAPVYTGSYTQLRNLTSFCKNASSYGQPLKTIVDYLVSQSSKLN